MGLYDRDYMRKERKDSDPEVQHSKLPDPENANISDFPSFGKSPPGQYKPSPTLPFAFWLWLFVMTLSIFFWAFLLLVRP